MSRWEAWLSRATEPVLAADLPIIDAHHHLWNRGGHRYLAEEYAADVSGHHVVATVYVECLNEYEPDGPPHLRPVGETRFAQRAGRGSALGLCAGIVPHIDLADTAHVAESIDAHREAAGLSFKGVRYVTAWDAAPDLHGFYPTRSAMLAEPAVRAGADVLASAGLSLDLWLYFHQLREAQSLAAACPELTIVIDHCGGPIGAGPYEGRRNEVYSAWLHGIRTLAQHPQVVMKFGGLGMPIAGFGWRSLPSPPDSDTLARAWRPYFEGCIEAFGPDRLMFESNFPVDRTGCNARALWNAFKRLAAGLSTAERTALFSGTAARVYRLS